MIYIEYDALVDGDDGGSAIETYNIYIDDGMDGDFSLAEQVGPSVFTWDTSSVGLSLT